MHDKSTPLHPTFGPGWPCEKNHDLLRPRPALRKNHDSPRPGQALRKKIMTRPGPGRPCEKNHDSPRPRPALRKKIMTRSAPAALRKKIMTRSLAGLGLGWPGRAGLGWLPRSLKSITFLSIIDIADSPCSDPYKTCRLLVLWSQI